MLGKLGEVGVLQRVLLCIEEFDARGCVFRILDVGLTVFAEQEAFSGRSDAERGIANFGGRVVQHG